MAAWWDEGPQDDADERDWFWFVTLLALAVLLVIGLAVT